MAAWLPLHLRDLGGQGTGPTLAGNRLVQELPYSFFWANRRDTRQAVAKSRLLQASVISCTRAAWCFFHRLRLSCRTQLVVLWHRWVACCMACWVPGSSGGSLRSARSCSLARCLARVAAASSGSAMRCCTAVRGWVKWRTACAWMAWCSVWCTVSGPLCSASCFHSTPSIRETMLVPRFVGISFDRIFVT